MCGRFTIAVTKQELLTYLREEYGISSPNIDFALPRYNVAPSQDVLAVIHDGDKYRVGTLKWGFVPHFAKDERVGHKMINARGETLHEKPSFSSSFRKKRCVILADGFYEWQRSGTSKRPYRFALKDGRLFAMAGLYGTYSRPDGSKLHTCTIVTTPANDIVGGVHERMPLIVEGENRRVWLDAKVQNPEQVIPYIKPFPANSMQGYPVSTLVNSPKNDVETCIEEVPTDTSKHQL